MSKQKPLYLGPLVTTDKPWVDPFIVAGSHGWGPILTPVQNWRAGREGSTISDVVFERQATPHVKELEKAWSEKPKGKHVLDKVVLEDHEVAQIVQAMRLERVPAKHRPKLASILLRAAYFEDRLAVAQYFGAPTFLPALGQYIGRAETVARLRQMIRDIREVGARR